MEHPLATFFPQSFTAIPVSGSPNVAGVHRIPEGAGPLYYLEELQKIILAKHPTLRRMREVSDCVDDAGMGGGETDGRTMTAGSY